MAPFPEQRMEGIIALKLVISPEYQPPTAKDKQGPEMTSNGFQTTAVW